MLRLVHIVRKSKLSVTRVPLAAGPIAGQHEEGFHCTEFTVPTTVNRPLKLDMEKNQTVRK